jgi:hypothetical protein
MDADIRAQLHTIDDGLQRYLPESLYHVLLGQPGPATLQPCVTHLDALLHAVSTYLPHYLTWDRANPCDPYLANRVSAAIFQEAVLSAYQVYSPTLKNVVIVGNDQMIPFRRVPDDSYIANESLYLGLSGVLPNNATHAALDLGYILTDDAYGDMRPLRWRGRELYVPDLAVGRLVESPYEIVRLVDEYLANNGQLQPRTALVTGYDFLIDSGTAISDTLEGRFYTIDGLALSGPGRPIQPKTSVVLDEERDMEPHGVLLLAGQSTTDLAFDPVIVRPVPTSTQRLAEPAFTALAWFPQKMFAINHLRPSVGSASKRLVIVPAQFRGTARNGIQRRFTQMRFAVTYSSSDDWMPPVIWQAESETEGNALHLSISVGDASGVERVLITYSTDGNTWQSRDLAYNGYTDCPSSCTTRRNSQMRRGARRAMRCDSTSALQPFFGSTHSRGVQCYQQ